MKGIQRIMMSFRPNRQFARIVLLLPLAALGLCFLPNTLSFRNTHPLSLFRKTGTARLLLDGLFLPSQQAPSIHQYIQKQSYSLSFTTKTTLTSAPTTLFCQLLGMNCATPTDCTFSLKGFWKRGGETDIHRDGWGVVFYDSNGIRQFHDVLAASESPMAKFLSEYPIRTLNMMGHIRYATVGQVELENVHPFAREMWGIQWCFCHNGEIPMFQQQKENSIRETMQKLKALEEQLPQDTLKKSKNPCSESYFHPVGTTDSEAAFCEILNALRRRFHTLPSLPILSEALQLLCQEIVSYDPQGTICNFLLTCGPHTQWVYSWPGSRPGSKVWNGLHYTVRQYPFQTKTTLLDDFNYSIDFSSVTTPDDCVSVIATAPLTNNEEWIEMKRGELILFDQGRPHASPKELFLVELKGHGLQSSVLQRPQLEDDMKLYNLKPAEIYQGSGI